MIGNINHIAIVVPDLDAAAAHWRDMLGAEVSQAQTLPEHGVRIVFVRSANGQVELMEPFGEGSPIAGFLKRNPDGGMHHICYEVANIDQARAKLEAKGARVLGDGSVKSRRTWQSGAVFASKGFQRHAYRIRTGYRRWGALNGYCFRDRGFYSAMVVGVLYDLAIWREDA
jgi:methylmalonyl-CoA/ethylmalonyl-CoA epimerase